MKKLLVALLFVSMTGSMVAGFSDDNLEAHETYRSLVGNRSAMHSDEALSHWQDFKQSIKNKKQAQKSTAKATNAKGTNIVQDKNLSTKAKNSKNVIKNI